MDIISHGNCLDGSLSVSLFLIGYMLHKKKIIKTEFDNFAEFLINKTKNMSKINIEIEDIEKILEVPKIIIGNLSLNEFKEFGSPNLRENNINLYLVALKAYDHYFKLLYKKNIFNHKKNPKEILVIFDITPKLDLIKKLSKFYKLIIIIDHHKTFKKNLINFENSKIDNLKIVFSEKISASGLVYKFLNNYIINFSEKLKENFLIDLIHKVKYVNENDTSISTNIKTCSFILGAFSLEFQILNNENLFKFLKYSSKIIMMIGKPKLKQKEKEIKEALKNYYRVNFFYLNKKKEKINFVCYALIISKKIKFISDIGGELASKSFKDFNVGLGLVITKSKLKYYISFRGTVLDKKFDCEKIAAFFGGGGHEKAAGCFINHSLFNHHFHDIKKIY